MKKKKRKKNKKKRTYSFFLSGYVNINSGESKLSGIKHRRRFSSVPQYLTPTFVMNDVAHSRLLGRSEASVSHSYWPCATWFHSEERNSLRSSFLMSRKTQNSWKFFLTVRTPSSRASRSLLSLLLLLLLLLLSLLSLSLV